MTGILSNKVTTLRQWQQTEIPCEEIIFNASEFHKCNDEWVPFTIGVAAWFNPLTIPGTHSKTVLCAITSVTDLRRRRDSKYNRAAHLQTLAKNGIINYKLSHVEYFKTLSDYKFIVSPEGNGVDCHRHYEALIAGCIPIIENHPGIAEKYRGCPVLFTNDYSEITEEYLNTKYEEMIDQVYDFSRLFLSSYDPETQREIRRNGNFWSNKVIGKEWYTPTSTK